MKSNPVRFVCPACSLDASEFVDGLIRQQLGQSETPPGRVVLVQATTEGPAVVASQLSTKPASRVQPTLHVRMAPPRTADSDPAGTAPERAGSEAVATGQADVEVGEAGLGPPCPKHRGEFAVEKCCVCSKPICPKCMELFGYVCSPLCKARAASHGIHVPVYDRQKSVVEARLWRKVAWVGWGVGVLAVGFLAFWIWYAWFGSTPKIAFSIRFPEAGYSGQSATVGTDQLIFLHGGTLARHDMLQKKEIWSRYVVNKEQIQAEVAQEIQQTKALISKANYEGWEHMPKMPDPEKLTQSLGREAAAALQLRVRGKNIWLVSGRSLVRYDWDTGKPAQEIPIPANYGNFVARGEELLLMNGRSNQITSINLSTCDSRAIEIEGMPKVMPVKSPASATNAARRAPQKAGLPTGMPGRDSGKVMDPGKVAAQAQHLSLPERIALPAVLANSWNQERALAELSDEPRGKGQRPAGPAHYERVELIPTKDGFVEFSTRLLEQKTIARAAMKAPTAKSVLEGPVNVTQTAEVANEILNDMQRERGGETIEEDVSRYLVTLRRPGAREGWSGEVIGSPGLFPLQTVNVVGAKKTLIVFDKANKKLWQNTLNYDLAADHAAFDELTAAYGQGPCVERKDALYVFDQGVLTGFDLKSGNVRWRVPSVGITGLFFDDEGMMYVNSTTASPENIKFSHQIDINQKAVSVVLKINPDKGKILWSAQLGGLVNYVSGKYIYMVQSFAPEEEEDNPYRQETGFESSPYLRIKRLNPRNGHQKWEYFQQRAPMDVQFEKNVIRLVFKKEVQVLKTLAW